MAVFSNTHDSNSNFTTRVTVNNGALGKVNYSVTFTRSSLNWTSWNLNTGTTTRPYLDLNILGNPVRTPWTYDFRNDETSQTTTRVRNSRVIGVGNPSAFRVGMVVQSGTGIPSGTTITGIGSTTVTMSNAATSNGTGVSSWFRQNTNTSVTIISGSLDVVAGQAGTISGGNNARSTIGNASISGSFTPTAPPTIPAPSAPSGLSTSSITKNSATLSWSASSGTVSRYRAYLNGSDAGTTTGTSFSFTGLSSNTTHTLGVRAEGPDNNSSITSTTAKTLPDTFTVPSVNGQASTTAVTNLINAGFGSVNQTPVTAGATLANNRTVVPTSVPDSQSPAAGTIATEGDTATIKVYSFERLVPSIVGLTKAQGEARLQEFQFSNFSSTLTTSGSTLANNKLVATQNPVNGTSRNVADIVTFETHDYRIAIPNLINLTRTAAATALNSAGFTKVTITTTEDGATQQNNNRVLSQSPVNSGTTYNPVDQAVSFVVYTLGVVGKRFTGATTSELLSTSARYTGTEWVQTLLAKRFNGTTWEDIA
jgi:chitodextrinase